MMRAALRLSRHATAAWIVAATLSLLAGALVARQARSVLEERFRARMTSAIDREVLQFRGLTEESKAMGALRLAGRLDPDLKAAALQTDLPVALRMRPAAEMLSAMNDQLGADVSFVVNRHGTIVGEWNRGLQRSPLGQDISHREYFRESMAGRTAVSMAISQATSRRALYLSAPVFQDVDARGPVIGIVATQFYGPSLDRFLTERADMASLVLSPEGVVMVSSRPEWLLMVAGPASAERSRRLTEGLRYGRQFLDATRVPVLPFDPGASVAAIDGHPHALVARDLGWRDSAGVWRLVLVADLSAALGGPAQAGIGLLSALLCFAALAALLRGLLLRAAKHAQETALQRQGERFMTLIEHTPAGIGLITDGVVGIANPALRRLVDVRIGQPWPDVYADDASRARAQALLQSNSNSNGTSDGDGDGGGSDVELQIVDREGAHHACLATFLPVAFGQSGTLIWLTDLTDRLSAENEIRAARQSAEATTRAKTDFFANMSHEAAHADERDHRHVRAGAADRARRAAAELRGQDLPCRGDPARRDRRHPRLQPHRGRPARARAHPVRARRGAGASGAGDRSRPGGKGRGAAAERAGRPAADAGRRPVPPRPGAGPCRQACGAAQRAGRGRRGRGGGPPSGRRRNHAALQHPRQRPRAVADGSRRGWAGDRRRSTRTPPIAATWRWPCAGCWWR